MSANTANTQCKWPRARLDECAEIVSGATPSTSAKAFWGGDICWATPKDLSTLDGAYISDTPRKLTPAGLKSCAATILPVGSVLFSSRAPIGHTAVNTVPMATNQGFKSFVPKPDRLVAKFLYWWLRAKRPYLENLGNGATFKEVSKAIVSRIEICLPPLTEQRRIATVLDMVDELRTQRRAALSLLDRLTHSIFFDMFGDPATNPKGWKIEPMASLFSVKHGFAFKSEYFTDSGEYTLLTPGNFRESGGYFDRGDKQKFYVGPIPPAYVLSANDLLVAMTEQAPGLLGSPILIPESNTFLHNQRLGLVEVGPGTDRLFLFHLFNTPAVRNQIQASSTGTKVKHTSPSKITAIEVPIPPVELQREFAYRMYSLEGLKAAQNKSLAELDALFLSLQHRAFPEEV